MGYFSTPTKEFESLNEKALFIINSIEPIFKENSIERVVIEDSLKSFATRRSSASTLILLSKMNGIVSFYIEKILNCNIKHVNASTARKAVLGKSYDRSFDSVKEFVLDGLRNKYEDDILLNNLPRMKRKDKLAGEAYDICDAIILGLFELKNGNRF